MDWAILIRKGTVALLRPWLWSWKGLRKADLSPDPFAEFAKWFRLARRCIWLEFPEAMCLSTIGVDGEPQGRIVLLKGYDARGFVFYTNLQSAKGRALMSDNRAALTMYWEPLQRQVRISGTVEPVTKAEADAYFSTRARLSQIGAWASKQSEVLESRKVLEGRVVTYKSEFRGRPVPRPPHWSGFRVIPQKIEFWKLRFNRLHDRFLYTRVDGGGWRLERLNP